MREREREREGERGSPWPLVHRRIEKKLVKGVVEGCRGCVIILIWK